MMSRTGLLWRGGVAGVAIALGVLGAISPAQAIERQFLGIRMLSRVQTVLARFGNPSQVTVGQVAYNLPGQQAGAAGAAAAPGRVGMAGLPGVPGVPGAPMVAGGAAMGGASPYAGYGYGYGTMMPPASGMGGPMVGTPAMPGGRPGMMGGPGGGMRGDYEEDYSAPMGGPVGAPMAAGGAFGSAPGLPGLPGGIGAPGRMGMAGMTGAPGMAGIGGVAGGIGLPSVGLRTTPGSMMYEMETTLVYERPGGVIYEFLVNKDGYVVQAKAIGYEDKSGLARTSRGIRLGDTYQRVLSVYGWPKEHQNMGTTLYISYPNYHVAFQFYNNRVVSIIVAAMEK